MKEKNEDLLALVGVKIIICKKTCQSLDRFGNDLCQRRILEDRNKISIHYVGHTPPPAPPDKFLIAISEKANLLLTERDAWLDKNELRLGSAISCDDTKEIARISEERERYPVSIKLCEEDGAGESRTTHLTSDENNKIPFWEMVGNESSFICPRRRRWAEKSDIQKGVIVNQDGVTLLVDVHGDVLDIDGEELPLKLNIPIPGQAGSEDITYLPTKCVSGVNGKTFFCRDWEVIKKITEEDIIKHLFRPSPVVKVDKGECP